MDWQIRSTTVVDMAGILEDIHPALKSLWDLENELRSAAQNAIFLRNDEAKKAHGRSTPALPGSAEGNQGGNRV